MKKVLSILFIFITSLSLIACQNTNSENDIVIGSSIPIVTEILNEIKEDIAKEGYNLVIKQFSDYVAPNMALASKELDANLLQHGVYMNNFNNANNTNLTVVLPLYHATFALYSKEYTEISQIPNGAKIVLPDDASNFSRGLYLLSQAGLITLNEDSNKYALTLEDVLENPKNLDFSKRAPVNTIATFYEEVGLAIMYPNNAQSLELEEGEQQLFVEKEDDVTLGLAISLVARTDNEDSDKIKVLIEALTTDKVRDYLNEHYGWASNPAF